MKSTEAMYWLQKTYVEDLFTKKTVKNTGELPMYLIRNHHIPIITPEVFDRVQVELARRNSLKPVSDKNVSKKSRYNSKYALTGLVVCGNCGSKYRSAGRLGRETAKQRLYGDV